MSVGSGREQWCPLIIVSRFDISSASHERVRDSDVASVGGQQQRRPPIVICDFGISSVGDQRLHSGDVVFGSGP